MDHGRVFLQVVVGSVNRTDGHYDYLAPCEEKTEATMNAVECFCEQLEVLAVRLTMWTPETPADDEKIGRVFALLAEARAEIQDVQTI